MSEYTQQADKFLTDNNLTFRATYLEYGPHFTDDKESRDIYRVTVSGKGRGRFSVKFGQSLAESGINRTAPTAYDMFTCITKSEPGTFEDFCGEFGYDEDSRKAMKTYRAVKREWIKVEKFFTAEEIEQLQEIN